MKNNRISCMMIGALAAMLWPSIRTIHAATLPSELSWGTVVNNLDLIPDTETVFNSYSQPSINNNGHVVFRAQQRAEADERHL